MLRRLILLILIAGAAVLALPFLVSSRYVDERGITIPGRVYSKTETVTVHYSGWRRSCELTVEYSPPDTASVAFLGVRLLPQQYDAFHKGEAVSLHYLQQKDIPDLPLARILRQMHALPTARLAGQRMFSGLEASFTRDTVRGSGILVAIVLLLVLWHRGGWPGFAWAVCAGLFSGAALLLISDFPTPEPQPVADVRHGSGRVKSLGRIDRLFEGSRQRGAVADQPIDVVGIEFVPEGRTEAVVAVDLIDTGSLPGLKEGGTVAVDYEGTSPRTAHLRSATRGFVRRNLEGIAVQGGFCVLLLAGFLAISHYAGAAWKRLLAARGTR